MLRARNEQKVLQIVESVLVESITLITRGCAADPLRYSIAGRYGNTFHTKLFQHVEVSQSFSVRQPKCVLLLCILTVHTIM